MTLVFGNPWGFLALLGIPLLVLVYFLRRRARVETVTTLFLLGRTQRESKAGRRFESFSNSLPFWLQVLAVLCLTWLLVEPRYENYRITRQIAVVMDSSASMQASQKKLSEKLREALKTLKGSADHASYLVLDQNPRSPRIYQGDNLDDLVTRLEDWHPRDGALDPRPVIRIARSLVGPDGAILYVTDHDGPPLPAGAQRWALGDARANCGFTGATVEPGQPRWTAILRNYGNSPQRREWTLETIDGRRSDPREVILPARQFVTLRGRFPEGARRCVLRLSGDVLPLDDVLPMVVNEPRPVHLWTEGPEKVRELGERMIRGFPHVTDAPFREEADLLLRSIESGAEATGDRPSIFFYSGANGARPSGSWLVRDHELSDDLNFEAMTLRGLEKLTLRGEDEVLLWLEGEPVILLRKDPASGADLLVFAFDFALSNAMKVPAVAVLLHRFAKRVARGKITPHTATLETGQQWADLLPSQRDPKDFKLIETPLDGAPVEVALREGSLVTQRAPKVPGFLELNHRGKPFLEASVVFADTREADLSRATSIPLPEMESVLVKQSTREDRWWRLAVLLLMVAVIAAWHFLTPQESS